MNGPDQPGLGGMVPAWGAPPPVRSCEICGSTPALDVTLRRVSGLVIFLKRVNRPCRLCRDCGIAICRDVQAQTLLKGWWSAGAFLVFNWIAVFGNISAYRALAALPPPRPPEVTSPHLRSTPLPQGTPLWRRPQSYAFLPLFTLFFAIALVSVFLDQLHLRGPQPIDGSNPESSIGRCVQITASKLDGTVDCSSDHAGIITGVTPLLSNECPNRSDLTFTTTSARRLCVDTRNHKP